MTIGRKIGCWISIALVTLLGSFGICWAQEYPTRPIRLIVPYAAGGNFDVIARLIAQAASDRLKQSVVVENIAGANGNIGVSQLSRTAPDGYTLTFVSNGTIAINPSLYASLGFDPLALTPISLVTANPEILVVRPGLSPHSFKELVDLARSQPRGLTLANGGSGTLSHLSAEMLQSRTGVKFNIVPYKGTSLALNDLMGEHVDAMFDTIGTSLPFVEQGKLRALAVTGKTRSELRPELPTLMEVGVANFSAEAISYLMGPPGLPDAITQKWQSAVSSALKEAGMKDKLKVLGVEGIGSSPEELRQNINEETKKWSEIIRDAGIKPQ